MKGEHMDEDDKCVICNRPPRGQVTIHFGGLAPDIELGAMCEQHADNFEAYTYHLRTVAAYWMIRKSLLKLREYGHKTIH